MNKTTPGTDPVNVRHSAVILLTASRLIAQDCGHDSFADQVGYVLSGDGFNLDYSSTYRQWEALGVLCRGAVEIMHVEGMSQVVDITLVGDAEMYALPDPTMKIDIPLNYNPYADDDEPSTVGSDAKELVSA